MEKGPEILACDPGVIKIHIRIMQMENQLWIRASLKNPLIERTRQFGYLTDCLVFMFMQTAGKISLEL